MTTQAQYDFSIYNRHFMANHEATEKDYEIFDKSRELLQQYANSSDTPKAGDAVFVENEKGIVTAMGHLEAGYDGRLTICVRPYTPFFTIYNDGAVKFSASGGYWSSKFEINELVYKDKVSKLFCRFGSYGGCAAGAIDIPVIVNRWYLKSENFY